LGLSFVLASLNLNIELGILYAKRTTIVPAIGLIALALSVCLNVLFIPVYGAIAAAVNAAAVGFFRLLLTVAANRRWGTPEVRTHWAGVTFVLVVATSLGILTASPLLSQPGMTTIAVRALLWLGLVVALLLSPSFTAALGANPRFRFKRSPAQGG
jgi:peptidoglycan biosynthesis protein MviN/MurJ (putative lipid II flippase)